MSKIGPNVRFILLTTHWVFSCLKSILRRHQIGKFKVFQLCGQPVTSSAGFWVIYGWRIVKSAALDLIAAEMKRETNTKWGQQDGSSGFERRLMCKRPWVWIPAPNTRWMVFHIFICCKVCWGWERLKINEIWAGVGPLNFFKGVNIQKADKKAWITQSRTAKLNASRLA